MTTKPSYHTRLTAESVAARHPPFKAHKTRASFWINCPVHGGNGQNCEIWDTENGNIWAKCHNKLCDPVDILKELGVWEVREKHNWDKWDFHIATYEHPDNTPRHVFREPCIKGETCWRDDCKPSDTKHIWGPGTHDGCYLLLWGEDAPSNVLVFCEGEKAAAALLSYELDGITPVTWRGGAQSAIAHKPNFDRARSRKVIIWPDNDEDGSAAAQAVAQSVYGQDAASIRLVEVSHLPHKADAADVSATDAYDLVDHPREWLPPAETHSNDKSDLFDELKQFTTLNAADYAQMFLPRLADRMLISTHRDMSGHDIAEVWLCNASGVWRRPDDELKAEIRKLIDERIIAVTDDNSMPERAKVREFKYINRAKAEQIDAITANFPSVRFTLERFAPETIKGLTIRSGDELDDNTRYLGAPNGVIDLHTGELLSGERMHGATLTTRMVPYPYDPDATHDDVDKLFSHLPAQERDWLLSALGFGLKGNPMRRMYFLRGDGGQGKGTVLTALAACLGPEYCQSIPEGALVTKRAASAGLAPELLFAHHARIAIQSELDKGSLNERIIKAISGGGRGISGRSPHSRSFDDRRSVCTMVISTNHRPRLNFNDKAMYDRARMLPYPMPPNIDEQLEERLQRPAQAQALLALLVQYAVKTQSPPEDVTSVHQEREDTKMELMGEVGLWLNEVVIQDYNARLYTTHLWQAALKAAGAKPEDKEAWGKTRDDMRDLVKDIHPDLPTFKRGRDGYYWLGYRLATADEMAGKAAPPQTPDLNRAAETIIDSSAEDLAEIERINELVRKVNKLEVTQATVVDWYEVNGIVNEVNAAQPFAKPLQVVIDLFSEQCHYCQQPDSTANMTETESGKWECKDEKTCFQGRRLLKRMEKELSHEAYPQLRKDG